MDWFQSNPNYSYRSFSCKQISLNLMIGIVLKIKQFNFFLNHIVHIE